MSDTSPPPSSVLVGTVLSERYRIDGLLGEGGMGAVFVGEHLLLHKRVAIKVLHPDMLGNAEVVARFEREAMASAHIDHPNVAVATDFGKLADGSYFLVLELLEGRSLRQVLDDEGALDERRALHITRQIAAALVRAHALGIVHRDLKPDNVMLVERDGDPDFVKVLDFGIAKVPVRELAGQTLSTPSPTKGLTQLGVMYGTPEYMAPEQILGLEIDARADLYALGVTLHELVSGERPFVADSRVAIITMHVSERPPSVRLRAPSASLEVEALILGLLEKEPARRIQEAREIVARLDDALGAPPASSLPRATQPHGPPSRVAVGARTELAAASPTTSPLAALRARLPPPLNTLPPAAFVAAPVALVVLCALGLGLLVLIARGSPQRPDARDPVAARADGVTASDDELQDARRGGASALQQLLARYPRDGRVARALVTELTEEKRRVEAMRELRALLDSDRAAADDDAMARAVRAAAEDPDAADAAFELMEGPLGKAGAELLYDLQTNPRVGARAQKALARPEVREASPAVAIAVDLRAALSCDAKRALLARAKEQGDRRVLGSLKALRHPTGCGFLRRGDCWPCMRRGTDLTDAIAAIEARDVPGAAASASP